MCRQGLKPSEQWVDGGSLDSALALASRTLGIELLVPALSDQSWQARTPGGYTLKDFAIDCQDQVGRRPQRHQRQPRQAFKRATSAGATPSPFPPQIFTPAP